MDKIPSRELVEECTRDLKAPWKTRDRLDRQVLGAIELAFLRGYQAGSLPQGD